MELQIEFTTKVIYKLRIENQISGILSCSFTFSVLLILSFILLLLLLLLSLLLLNNNI